MTTFTLTEQCPDDFLSALRIDGPPAVIAQTNISRSSGFPRMAHVGDQVHFTWTEFGKPSRVRTAVANVAAYK